MPEETNPEQKEKVEAFKKKSAEYAQAEGFRLNPDEKFLDVISGTLVKNETEKGAPYCPCRPLEGNKEEDDKKICPCFWHKDELEKDGHCKCRLFVK